MGNRTSHEQTESQLGNSGVRDFAEGEANMNPVDVSVPPAREEFTPPRFDDERPELNPDRKYGSTESGWEQGARTQSKQPKIDQAKKAARTNKRAPKVH